MLAKTGVHHFAGNNVELGTACGQYFRVCTLVITGGGDSDIIKQFGSRTFRQGTVRRRKKKINLT